MTGPRDSAETELVLSPIQQVLRLNFQLKPPIFWGETSLQKFCRRIRPCKIANPNLCGTQLTRYLVWPVLRCIPQHANCLSHIQLCKATRRSRREMSSVLARETVLLRFLNRTELYPVDQPSGTDDPGATLFLFLTFFALLRHYPPLFCILLFNEGDWVVWELLLSGVASSNRHLPVYRRYVRYVKIKSLLPHVLTIDLLRL